jgi:hypothetical protein
MPFILKTKIDYLPEGAVFKQRVCSVQKFPELFEEISDAEYGRCIHKLRLATGHFVDKFSGNNNSINTVNALPKEEEEKQ